MNTTAYTTNATGTVSELQELVLETLTLSAWTNPSTGVVRYYLTGTSYENRLKVEAVLAGYRVSTHKTGNISRAEVWDAEAQEFVGTSNSKAKKAAENVGKVYYDTAAESWVGFISGEVKEALNALL